MKLDKINITEKELEDKGLKSIEIRRLGRVVAFIGKNGAGKTRILKAIQDHLTNDKNITILDNISDLPNSIVSDYKSFKISSNSLDKKELLQQIQNQLKKYIKVLNNSNFQDAASKNNELLFDNLFEQKFKLSDFGLFDESSGFE